MNRNVHEANQRNNNRKKSIISFAYDVSEMKADKNKSMSVVSEDIEKGVNVEAVAGVFIFKLCNLIPHIYESRGVGTILDDRKKGTEEGRRIDLENSSFA